MSEWKDWSVLARSLFTDYGSVYQWSVGKAGRLVLFSRALSKSIDDMACGFGSDTDDWVSEE